MVTCCRDGGVRVFSLGTQSAECVRCIFGPHGTPDGAIYSALFQPHNNNLLVVRLIDCEIYCKFFTFV